MRLTSTSFLAGLLLASTVSASPTFVNGLAIPGDTADFFGSSVNDGRVGFFSDIYYDPNRNDWWGLSDRGPGGGTLSYETRVQRFTLDIDTTTGAISNFQYCRDPEVYFSRFSAERSGAKPYQYTWECFRSGRYRGKSQERQFAGLGRIRPIALRD